MRVLDDQALDEVVDVGRGELQIDAGVALDLARALEVADAAVEQNDLRDRQLLGRLELRIAVADGRFVLRRRVARARLRRRRIRRARRRCQSWRATPANSPAASFFNMACSLDETTMAFGERGLVRGTLPCDV